MRAILLLSLIALGFSFGVSQTASAVCVQNGNTPGGGNIINCPAPVQNNPLNLVSVPNTTNLADEVNIPVGGGLNVLGVSAIRTEAGDDIVTTSGDVITDTGSAINVGSGSDMVIVDGGNLTGGGFNAIQMTGGPNTVIVNAGTLSTNGINPAILGDVGVTLITINGGTLLDDIRTGPSDDVITFNGGSITSSPQPLIDSGGGNDTVNLNGGIYNPTTPVAIELGPGNDTLTFGADIDLGGFVDCGDGFDTLVFAMDVPEEAVPLISSQILAAGLPDGSVVINDINYEWENCELLVPDLNGVLVVRPIPTLSEWGLIAMAGVLGLVGFLTVRRRAAA